MIVILYPDALNDVEGQLDLLALVWAALHRRHTLLVDPPYASGDTSHPGHRWLLSLPPAVAEVAQLLLEEHLIQATTTPKQTTLHVHARGYRTDLAWPDLRLPCNRAAAFALRPLGVLLEDRRSDRAFLLAAAPRRWRVELEQALAAGALEFLNGGGLGNMLHQVREQQDAESAARLWALFDRDHRDGAVPGTPSKDSERLREACEALRRHGLGHHQLRCRSIENYLPIELLKTWASVAGIEGAPSTVDRIATLEQHERNHLHLKKELGKGVIPELLIHRRFELEERWLRRDGHHDEICEICESIIAHL